MNQTSAVGLINNAALLLALILLYDMLGFRLQERKTIIQQILTGIILGAIGLAIMFNSWNFGQGLVFDTRSVLLVISGFFFGSIPVIIAVLMTGVFRFISGGAGVWTGLAVIVTSGVIGLFWRNYRPHKNQKPSITELYLLGIVVHVVMLGCFFLLPGQFAIDVLSKISLPVMFIYPIATAILGNLMVMSEKRRQYEKNLRESEERYRELVENANSIILRMDSKGQVSFFNEFAQKFFGYETHEVMGRSVVGIIVPETDSSGRDLLSMITDIGLHPQLYINNENENIRKDGTHIWIAWTNKPFYNSTGGVSEILCIGNDITHLKRVEMEKDQLLSQLQATLEATVDGIVVVGLDEKIKVFSNRFKKIWNMPDSVLNSKDANQFLACILDHLNNPEVFSQKVKTSFVNLSAITFDTLHLKDGRFFDVYSRPQKLDDEIIGRVWGFRDVTEKKIAMDALRASEEKLRNIVENSSNLFYSHTVEHEIIYISPQCQDFLQCEPEEAMIRWTEFATDNPINQKGFELTTQTIKTGMRQHPFELELMGKKGKNIFVEVREAPILKNGKTVAIVGSLTDITERKQAEVALRESEAKYRNLVENINDVIYSIDANGIVTFVSSRIKNILEYQSSEIIGKNFTQFVHPEDIPLILKRFQNVLSGDILVTEYRLIAKSGEFRWVRSSSRPAFEGDRAVRIAGVFVDITEQKNLEDQLRQSQKMESIGNLAGGIAHEFNNMLAIIMGNNELIIDELPQGNLARESAEEIRIAGLRARDVVKQLLTFSRQDDAVKKVMDFRLVVEESMKLIRSTTPVNIKIELNLSVDTCPVMGNDTQINQLLINLCNNAVDALPEKDGIITIELKNETIDIQQTKLQSKLKPGQYAKMMVSDNGSGMDNATLDRVFEPYFTTKDIGKGTGIGMAVAHGIVERHGGTIIVDSKLGRGTTFTIFLPAHDGQIEQENDGRDILPVGDECILYVDDEPSIAKLGKRLLESLGYTTESITDPEKALDMVRSDPNKFDLLITDMAMPNMTGDQLVIETLKIRQDMPIIICTGYSANISEKEAVDIGVCSFIMKPINKSELAKMVRKVLVSAKKSNIEEP